MTDLTRHNSLLPAFILERCGTSNGDLFIFTSCKSRDDVAKNSLQFYCEKIGNSPYNINPSKGCVGMSR